MSDETKCERCGGLDGLHVLRDCKPASSPPGDVTKTVEVPGRGRFTHEQLADGSGPRTQSPPGDVCTGLTAAWCPVHGDCTCPRRDMEMDASNCPLHAAGSTHADATPPAPARDEVEADRETVAVADVLIREFPPEDEHNSTAPWVHRIFAARHCIRALDAVRARVTLTPADVEAACRRGLAEGRAQQEEAMAGRSHLIERAVKLAEELRDTTEATSAAYERGRASRDEEVAGLRRDMQRDVDAFYLKARDINAALTAERDAARAEAEQLRQHVEGWIRRALPAEEERDRLRAALDTARAEVERLTKERTEALRVLGNFPPSKMRAADSLADEVDVLVRRKVIDSRSPAADALLDYRSPPSSDRSCALVAARAEVERLRAEWVALRDDWAPYGEGDGRARDVLKRAARALAGAKEGA